MKAKQLVNRLNKIIDKYGNINVYFDTGAVTYNVHLVSIDNINTIDKNIINKKYIILTTNDQNYVY